MSKINIQNRRYFYEGEQVIISKPEHSANGKVGTVYKINEDSIYVSWHDQALLMKGVFKPTELKSKDATPLRLG